MRSRRLNAVFAALPTPVFAWEARGNELYLVDCNAAAERQTRGGIEHVIGKPASEVYATQPRILAGLNAALRSSEPLREEVDYTMLTTGERHTLNVTYIRAEPDLVLVVTEDLTRQRTAERALVESEQQYRTLVERAPDGIVVHREGRILYVNEEFVRMLGARSAAEVVGTRVLDHVHPDDRQKVAERVAALGAGGQAPLREERLLRTDGSVVYAEIVGITTMYGGQPAVQAIVRDVSERRKAQALFVALSEQSLTGISVVQDGRVQYANSRCAELFGYSLGEFIGIETATLVAASSRDIVEEMQRERLEQGHGSVHFTFSAIRKDGTLADIEVFGTVAELDGRPVLVGTLLDASERERLARELRQAQKMDAIGRLAGGIAHDFNNIMTAVLSYADLVLAELPPDSPIAEDVREIKLAGNRAAALTRQLLAFSRRQPLEARVVSMNEVVERMGAMLHRLIGGRVTLTVRVAPELPRVLADPGQMEQVLLNLAVNARDAMADGGQLTIETGVARYHADEASQHPGLRPGDYVRVAVSDTGPGIPADVQSRIFEPFFTTKPAGQGTGLGLSVVYGIVKQSGGYVMVDSEMGRGTTFTVLLPALAGAK